MEHGKILVFLMRYKALKNALEFGSLTGYFSLLRRLSFTITLDLKADLTQSKSDVFQRWKTLVLCSDWILRIIYL